VIRIEGHKTHSTKQKNYWMYVSIFLGVILLFTLYQNYQTNKFILNAVIGNTPTLGAPSQPSPQAAPQPPSRQSIDLDDDPVLGDENAPVTIVSFEDFQCPFCKRSFDQTFPQLKKEYIDTGKVKYVYRDFPLSFHPEAQPAAEAAECADEQGKFWEMHDLIFQNQAIMSNSAYKQWAEQLGLDTAQFNDCLDSGKYRQEVQSDSNYGSQVGVSGTPTFFINGIRLVGAQPFEAFKQIIDAELNS